MCVCTIYGLELEYNCNHNTSISRLCGYCPQCPSQREQARLLLHYKRGVFDKFSEIRKIWPVIKSDLRVWEYIESISSLRILIVVFGTSCRGHDWELHLLGYSRHSSRRCSEARSGVLFIFSIIVVLLLNSCIYVQDISGEVGEGRA